MNQLEWFEKFGCEKIKITKYESASSPKVLHEKIIQDKNYIRLIQSEINQLPFSGDMSIKMGPTAPYLTLDFSCDGKNKIIEFYNSKIKTPSTTFFSETNKIELAIWNQINSHFNKAEVGKPVPKCENCTIEFDHFSVKYISTEDKTPKGLTATLIVETFMITNLKDKSVQNIQVRSGQLPPKPEEFKIGSNSFVLRTYTQKDGTSIHPATFIIEAK